MNQLAKWMRSSIGAVALAAVALGPAVARACPVCETEAGRQIREGIFGPAFGSNFLITIVPFAVVVALVRLVPRVLYFLYSGVERPSAGDLSPRKEAQRCTQIQNR
jgi:hypothetical protein